MTIVLTTGQSITLPFTFFKSDLASTVTPAPAIVYTTPAGGEASGGTAALQNGSGTYPFYTYTFNQTPLGMYQVFARTTDPLADFSTLVEFVRVVSASGGGGGATAQEVWEYASRTLTSTGQVLVTSPVLNASTIELRRGDDYLTAQNRSLKFTSDDWTIYNLSTALAIVFRLAQPRRPVFVKAGSYIAPNVVIELTSSETSTFVPTVSGVQPAFEIEATLAGGQIVTLVRGGVIILPDIR